MGFSSHKLLFVLSSEIRENFYRWGDRSAHPQTFTPSKKNEDFIFVTGENSNTHLVPHLSDEPNEGTTCLSIWAFISTFIWTFQFPFEVESVSFDL